MATILITGADRGIGAALVRHYRARGERAIAACLGEGADLAANGIEVVGGVDVTRIETLRALRTRLADTRLDVVISNAGAFHADQWPAFDYAAMARLYDINTLGPLRVMETLADLLGPGSKVGIITSRVGSLGDNSSGGMYGYRMSKCAANALGINLYHELRPRGIAVMLLHPGQVRTEMTRELTALGEHITPEQSAAGLIAQLDALNASTPPEFRHANGALLPW